MALPSSGTITLSQMHVEVGGGATAEASLNDSDIRGLISKSSEASMSFNEWYGASATSEATKSNTIRPQGTGLGVTQSRSVTSAIAISTADVYLKVTRTGQYVYVDVREGSNTAATSNWYNTSSSAATLGSSYQRVMEFDCGSGNSASHAKINWDITQNQQGVSTSIVGNTSLTGANHSASDNSYQALSDGQSVGARGLSTAIAECYQTASGTQQWTFIVSIKDDTNSSIVETTSDTFKVQQQMTAISNNCF